MAPTKAATKGKNRLRGRKTDSPVVRLSKTLSYALRHGAQELGLNMRPSGFVAMGQLLSIPMFQQYTEEDIEQVMQQDAKNRFTITTDVDGEHTFIRANQGHSVRVVDDEELLTPLTDATDVPKCLHGTYLDLWPSIWEKGLCRMTRNHIHFTSQEMVGGEIVSGVRSSCNLLVYIDLSEALADGVRFYRSSNNVILSPGIGDQGVLDRKYFRRAVKRLTGEVIYERGANCKAETGSEATNTHIE